MSPIPIRRRPKCIPGAHSIKNPKPRKRRSRPAAGEHAEQARVIAWARKNAIRHRELAVLFAIPNGARLAGRTINGRRVSREGEKLKAEGLLPGASDLFLPAARGGFHGLFIEMKYGDNQATLEQQRFMASVLMAGYAAAVCWGAEATIQQIENYLALK